MPSRRSRSVWASGVGAADKLREYVNVRYLRSLVSLAKTVSGLGEQHRMGEFRKEGVEVRFSPVFGFAVSDRHPEVGLQVSRVIRSRLLAGDSLAEAPPGYHEAVVSGWRPPRVGRILAG